MRLLLDTHTFLWYADDDTRLSVTSIALLNDATNELHLSTASIWEIAIKVGLKKLSLSAPHRIFIERAILTNNITLLPITLDDCVEYEQLSFPNPKHRDPFDRMIITHARRHGLSIVGTDVAFDSYGVPRLW